MGERGNAQKVFSIELAFDEYVTKKQYRKSCIHFRKNRPKNYVYNSFLNHIDTSFGEILLGMGHTVKKRFSPKLKRSYW